MEKIQTIELFIKDDEDGVFAISLVESPAIEENFVALSEQKEDENKFMFEGKVVDKERRIVVGFALVPDKEILRVHPKTKKKFNIKFSTDTVAKSAERFMLRLNGNNVTEEHKKPVKGCGVIESWVVEDPKHDKTNIWNLGAKGGEWAIMMKLTPEEAEKAQNGTYNGFSIEATYDGFEQLEQSVELSEEEKLNEILKIIES